jgi:hypothetical protein
MPKPERFDGYIRVSRRVGRKGPGYVSPTVQKEAIARWAEYRGVEIAAWHADEDESGGTERAGEPVARIAAQMVSQLAGRNLDADRPAASTPAAIEDDDLDVDRHAPWIEPVMGDPVWRRRMWGAIVALHGRYPQALAHLKDGWWEDSTHVETLCALVVWRDWIDVAADDPRFELAFPGTARRLRTRAPPRRRQCDQRLDTRRAATRLGSLRGPMMRLRGSHTDAERSRHRRSAR